ncbi:MerR family transcriptional regulator [Kineosporia rhizophila]|uniref:MerR family transcriptional regulator n=1 Tax=Kineosporia rhizophila TaxID=84633 RepID=UPI001E2C0D51|nr:MerR family transcriptional regulator [Kineosporia rhizophila]MCE0536884.1 MerR family transcriptional regulator [Kineosporia rhizophila]
MEWSIQEIARLTGATSRTLRHYDDVGLLAPSRTGPNGQRYYDQAGLVRLQRILLLRQFGLGLPAVAEVLDGEKDEVVALRRHLELLEREQDRIERQAESIRTTIRRIERGEPLMAEEALDGFDHTQYEEEVTQRWGRDAYEKGDRWWRSLTPEQKNEIKQQGLDVAQDFARAKQAGEPAHGETAQEIARRHVHWLSLSTEVSRGYVIGLGEMYVADPRFGSYYTPDGEDPTPYAEYVRDALMVYAENNL